ncbi:hypothetical protein MMPV_004930 [Pyropia vietnamensis]
METLRSTSAAAGHGAAVVSALPFSAVAGVTLLVMVASSLVFYTLTRQRVPTGVPGPPPYPVVGNVFHIDAHNLPKSFNSLHSTYGRVVKLHLGPRVMVSVADSELAEAIFTASRGGWSNSDLFRFVFGPFFPRSAIVVEGADWRRIRRVLHSAVAGGGGGGQWPSGKEGVLPPTRAAVERGLARLAVEETVTMPSSGEGAAVAPSSVGTKAGIPVDVMTWFQEIMFESLGGYAFGVDWKLYPEVADDRVEAAAHTQRPIYDAMRTITGALPRRVSRPWSALWSLPTEENRRVWAAQATIRDELASIIACRRKDRARAQLPGAPPLQPVPLLDALLNAAGDANGEGDSLLPEDARLSEADVLDNAATVAFAGTDTTAATLAFLFYHLATHPKVQADLVAEIEAATAHDTPANANEGSNTGSTLPTGGSVSDGGVPSPPRKQLSAVELDALPLLSAVVSESSRLLPTSFAIPRTPRKTFTYGDMVIPTGTLVIINVLRMGQDEELWPAPAPGITPQDFCVDRWLGGDATSRKRTAYAHLPFGAGDRSCLGRPVALSQVKAIVVQVLAAGWELLPVEGRELKLAIRMALVPEGGAWVTFRRRQR